MAICSFTGEEVIFCSDDVCLRWPIYRRERKTLKKPPRLIKKLVFVGFSPRNEKTMPLSKQNGGGEEFELIEFVLRDML